jgi:hypothetical protein
VRSAAVQVQPRVDGYVLELLREILAEQRRLRGDIQDLRAALERRPRGSRDSQDAALFPAMQAAVGDRPFTTRQIFESAELSTHLKTALLGCDLDNPRQLGQLLRRLEGPLGDVRLERVSDTKRHSEGIRWRFVSL